MSNIPASAKKVMESLPQYWNLLSDADKNTYNALRYSFSPVTVIRSRGTPPESFESMLLAIRMFAERGNDQDWRRFLVCGICWIDEDLAINTRQLRILLSKCKSSINGSLQRIGYVAKDSHVDSWKLVYSKIPILRDNFVELRQWTIRKKVPPEKTQEQVLLPPLRIPPPDVLANTPEKKKDPEIYPLKFQAKIRTL